LFSLQDYKQKPLSKQALIIIRFDLSKIYTTPHPFFQDGVKDGVRLAKLELFKLRELSKEQFKF
jgi:hypothetical protein